MQTQQSDFTLDMSATSSQTRITNLTVLLWYQCLSLEKDLKKSLEVGMALISFLTFCGAFFRALMKSG